VTGSASRSFTDLAHDAVTASTSPASIRHIPLGMLRMLAHAAQPFSPAFARQSQAAVVMNTTDMTAASEPAPSARH
jgi:hypothetical protein